MNTYSVLCTGASQLAAPINTDRKALVVQNQDRASTVWVGFGQPASATNGAIAVGPQEAFAMTAESAPTQRIEVFGPAGARVGVWEQ